MGVSVTREMYANFDEANRESWEALLTLSHLLVDEADLTYQASTVDPTPLPVRVRRWLEECWDSRSPIVRAAIGNVHQHHVREAWERLWSNECIDARSRAMATADRPGAKSGREVPPKPAPLGPVTIDRGGIFG